jgi:hypothetical protein
MKKYSIALLALLMFVASFSFAAKPASALTLEDLQASIQKLEQRVSLLETANWQIWGPRIASITNNVDTDNFYPRAWIKVKGTRLTNDVRITNNNDKTVKVPQSITNVYKDGTRIDFQIPANMPLGPYYLNIYAANGEKSNTMPFRIEAKKVDAPAQPTITVVSPNGGESYVTGSQVPLRFSTTLTDKQTSGITLQLYKKTTDSFGKMYVSDIVAKWVGGSPYSWTIPSTVAPGEYFIYAAGQELVGISGEIIDFSDNSFSITSPDTASGRPRIEGPVVNNVTTLDGVTNTWYRFRGARLTNDITIRKYGETTTSKLIGGVVSGVTGNAAAFLDVKLTLSVGSYQVNIIGTDGTVSNTVRLNVKEADKSTSKASQIAAVASALEALISQLKAQ